MVRFGLPDQLDPDPLRSPAGGENHAKGPPAAGAPRCRIMDSDHIRIDLDREDAAALVYVLDSVIEPLQGTGYGALLKSLQTTLIGAFGGVRPERPDLVSTVQL
jgi:hypothetical protein